MKNLSCDFLISGGGIVGLSIANQLLEKNISKKIIIIEKECNLGMHTSGRNSGVLHAGIYYEPNSMKANVCIPGSIRLKEWIKENINKDLKIELFGQELNDVTYAICKSDFLMSNENPENDP